MNDMGAIIKRLRLQKGLTQEELGEIIGVQKSAIRKYESGMVQNMKRSSIKKLADFFEVTPSYLLGYEADDDAELTLTPREKSVIIAYRNNPNMQNAVDKLLGVEEDGIDLGEDMVNTVKGVLQRNPVSK